MRIEFTWLGIGCLALACCASDSPVGKSGLMVNDARFGKPTAIVAGAGEQLGWHVSSVGDLDADGIDDFVIYGEPIGGFLTPEADQALYGHLYLFYGRERFPEKLSSADADAVLGGEILHSGPAGDVNGDGKADLLISGVNWAQFIFGSSRRLQGQIEVAQIGVRWLGPTRNGQPLLGQRSLRVVRSGDVNGDGLGDLLAGVAAEDAPAGQDPDGLIRKFLILGRKDGWPAGLFQASWAQAMFDVARTEPDGQTTVSEIATPLGDIDGDGYADVSAIDSHRADRIFYGGPDRFKGILGSAEADAILDHGGSGLAPIGDVDGDGCDDLATRGTDARSGIPYPISVVYSPSTRWSGAATTMRGLQISMPVDPQWNSGADIMDIRGADVDQDGRHDILLAAPDASEIYLIRGTGERRVGSYRLQASELLMRGVNFTTTTGQREGDALGSTIDVDGDLDGNGGPDVLAGAPGQTSTEFTGGSVYVIPGSGPRPF